MWMAIDTRGGERMEGRIEEKEKISIMYDLFGTNQEHEIATGVFGAVDAKSAVEELMEWVVPALIESLEEYPSGIFSLVINASETSHSGGLLCLSDTEFPVEVKCGRCGIELGTLSRYKAELKCPECDLTHVIFEEVI